MRIAYLTQSYPPMISGAAISAQQTAEAMANHGHKVMVIAASDRKYAYHTYRDNLTIIRLRSLHNPLRVGQRFIPKPRRQVMKALKQFKPDLIHSHEPLQLGALARRYAKHTHIPVTLTTHQLPSFVASYLPKKLGPIIERTFWAYARISLKRYTELISPTQTTATIIEEQIGLTPKVISYGLDMQKFHPPLHPDLVTDSRKKLNLPLNIPLIIHVGRLDADKSVHNVIYAAAPAIRESEAHLLIVGDGKQKQNLIRLCREMGIQKRVHFTGYIHPSNLPEIYRLADIFVTASEIETQGIVLLEAAASGLPIVAVDATCISEVVHNRVNGFLIRSGDIHGFSQALLSLINDPKGSCKMGMKGRTLVSEQDIQNSWKLHEDLYFEMTQPPKHQYMTKPTERLPQWDFLKTLMGLK